MAKAFKKDQLVTFISDYDRKGTVYFVNAIVYSCGNKQMVLINEATGQEMGRHFKPTLGNIEVVYGGPNEVIGFPGGTFPRMTKEEAIEVGMKIAANIQQYNIARLNRCIEMNGTNAGYVAAIRKDLDALHELTVIEK